MRRRNRIRLNESQLHRIIKESVKNILRESDGFSAFGDGYFRHDSKSAAHGYINGSVNMPDPRCEYPYNGDCDSNRMNQDNIDFNRRLKRNANAADKRWGKAADERPLHRKDSLNRVIKESIKRVLREGGHLYHKDEDGNIYTNSKESYRGVPGTTYIWHGEWSDPEILYKGKALNANDVEESLWYSYQSYCEKEGIEPTEEGFDEWLDADYVQSELDDYIAFM